MWHLLFWPFALVWNMDRSLIIVTPATTGRRAAMSALAASELLPETIAMARAKPDQPGVDSA